MSWRTSAHRNRLSTHWARHGGDGALRRVVDRAPGRDRVRSGAPDPPRLPLARLLDDRHPRSDDAVARRRRQLLDAPAAAANRTVQLYYRIPGRRSADVV